MAITYIHRLANRGAGGGGLICSPKAGGGAIESILALWLAANERSDAGIEPRFTGTGDARAGGMGWCAV